MNFPELLKTFRGTIKKYLDSKTTITEKNVKGIAKILVKFVELKLSHAEVKEFSNSLLILFVFLNNYVKQPPEISMSNVAAVKMILCCLMEVIDNVKRYQIVARKLTTLINVLLESDPHIYNIMEYLRIYSFLLHRVSFRTIEKICAKRDNYCKLWDLIKQTREIEVQGRAIEVLIKLYQNCSTLNLPSTFLNIVKKSTSTQNLYSSIRLVIEKANQDSSAFFSINCKTIKVDTERVEEFQGATEMDDIWLDVNFPQKKGSFFCTRSFLERLGYRAPYSDISWEMMSFHSKDTSILVFSYNRKNSTLTISFSINQSKLHSPSSHDKKNMHLEITVARDADKFDEFVDIVLPGLFPLQFEHSALDIPPKDDSTTLDTFPIDSTVSSPVIHRFEKSATEAPSVAGKKLGIFNTSSISSISVDENARATIPIRNENRKTGSFYFEAILASNRATPESFSDGLFDKSYSSSKIPESNNERISQFVGNNFGKSFEKNSPTLSDIDNSVKTPKATEEMGVCETGIAHQESLLEDEMRHAAPGDLNSSKLKVQKWLEKLEPDILVPLPVEDPVVVLQMPEGNDSVIPKNNFVVPEEELALIMSQETTKADNDKASVQSYTTNKLLNILVSEHDEISVDVQKTIINKVEPDDNNTSQSSSDIPLNILAEKINSTDQKNEPKKVDSQKPAKKNILPEPALPRISEEKSPVSIINIVKDPEQERDRLFDDLRNESVEATPKKTLRRKLYNPNDLSYLNLGNDTMDSKEGYASLNDTVMKFVPGKGIVPQVLIKKDVEEMTNRKNVTSRMLEDLKQYVRENKKRKKAKPTTNKLKRIHSSDSSSVQIIEPKAKKSKSSTRVEEKSVNRKKKGRPVKVMTPSSSSSFGSIGTIHNEGKNVNVQANDRSKVKIISNILIQPSNDLFDVTFTEATDFYLTILSNVEKYKPHLLNNENCKKVLKILCKSCQKE